MDGETNFKRKKSVSDLCSELVTVEKDDDEEKYDEMIRKKQKEDLAADGTATCFAAGGRSVHRLSAEPIGPGSGSGSGSGSGLTGRLCLLPAR